MEGNRVFDPIEQLHTATINILTRCLGSSQIPDEQCTAAARYPLVFATISGAHLYGFPSADSDFDLRGVHPLPNVGSRSLLFSIPGSVTPFFLQG